MGKAGSTCAVLALVAWTVGCGDDEGAGPADAGGPDAPIFDAGPDAAPDADVCPNPVSGPGSTCPDKKNVTCDSAAGAGDGFCIAAEVTAVQGFDPEGYCFASVDDMGTLCAADNECPTGSICTSFGCAQPCCAGDVCTRGRMCVNEVFGLDLGRSICFPGKADAIDGDVCSSTSDCNKSSDCFNDPNHIPGGQCGTLACTVGDDTTCAPNGDGHCVELVTGAPVCVDVCVSDSDCREVDGYFCFDDTARGAGKYCRHPKVGDPCASVADCGGAPMLCKTDGGFVGGYCTFEACTPGVCADGGVDNIKGVCSDPGGGDPTLCVQDCDPGSPNCRTGYSCQAVLGTEFACLPS